MKTAYNAARQYAKSLRRYLRPTDVRVLGQAAAREVTGSTEALSAVVAEVTGIDLVGVTDISIDGYSIRLPDVAEGYSAEPYNSFILCFYEDY